MHETPKYHRALSFDGGGIRGVFQAQFLAELKQLDICKKIDLFAGTSTGAILAVCLALGFDPEEIADLYRELGFQIFDSKANIISRLVLDRSKYSSSNLRRTLESKIGKVPFGKCQKRVLIVATDLNKKTTTVFDSSVEGPHQALPIVELLMASTAAPTYFSPHDMSDGSGRFVDGGVTCNNPAMECVLALINDRSVIPERIRILSIANGGRPIALRDSQESGPKHLLVTANYYFNVSMIADSNRTHRACEHILNPSHYIRIDPELKEEIELDDYNSAISILPQLAKEYAARSQVAISGWLNG